MDKSWIEKPRNSKAYMDGVVNFIRFATEKSSVRGKIVCPCRKCSNCSSHTPEVVEEHLMWKDFSVGYTEWIFHGESLSASLIESSHNIFASNTPTSTNVHEGTIGQDDIRGLLRDAIGIPDINLSSNPIKLRFAPTTLSGTDTLRQLEGINFQYGKCAKFSKKRAREEVRNVINEELVEKDNNTSQVAVFEDADDFINDPQNLDEDGVHRVPKMAENNCPEEIIAIARGPNNVAKRYSGFVINGFRFHTKNREKLRKTQNSGVMVEAEGQDYYGKLTDIFELDYYGSFKVVLFRCEWVDIRSPRGMKKDTNGFVLVNFSKLMHTGHLLKDDPFIFSSQAKQVFYIQDVKNEEWSYVLITKPRDLMFTDFCRRLRIMKGSEALGLDPVQDPDLPSVRLS
uniref:Transposase-associated domain-containing protein n=1 Tax=Ananas comosus var. bracteatus TaxID=296719 RepID=A0A6V7PRT2_ANACO|nr:unnamed protein product [Ananas comosus var. bracteatus]